MTPIVGQNPDEFFQKAGDALDFVPHEWILKGVEERIVNTQF
jgi:hypothetical protein